MNKSTKIILITIGIIVLGCGCLAVGALATGFWSLNQLAIWGRENVSEDPGVAVRVGTEIAEFEVPGGYGSPVSIHIGELTLLQYTSEDNQSHLFLAQFPEGTSLNIKELLRTIQQHSGNPNSIWYNTDTTLVEEKPITIRGQASTMQISEGTSSEGVAYRVATAQFRGLSGPALVMITSQISEWDQAAVEQFISSIR